MTKNKSNWGGKREGAGRPKKENPRTITIAIACSQEEKDAINRMSKESGLSKSQFILRKVFC